MRRRRHDMSERHRVVVPLENAAGHEPCEMRHLDHEHGTDLVGYLAELREVDLSRVRAVSREEHERLYLACLPTNLVEIEQHRRAVDGVHVCIEELARVVVTIAMCQVPTRVVVEPEKALAVRRLADTS